MTFIAYSAPTRKPIQHRSSGCNVHVIPIVNTNIGSRCLSAPILLFGFEVYASFDLVLEIFLTFSFLRF